MGSRDLTGLALGVYFGRVTGNLEVIRQFPQLADDCADFKSHPATALPNALDSKLRNIVTSVFTPVLAKHSKSFSLIDCISVGVDRMQRNFEPMRKQVEAWQRSKLTDVTAKVVIYEAFVEGRLEAPKHLARSVHDLYFEPLRIARRKGCNAECIVTRSCVAHQTPIPIPR